MNKATINGERLWDSLMAHGRIGGLPNGGVCRESLTPADIEGRNVFVTWCRDAGLEIGIDALGTIYATRPGTDNSLEPVAMGSHLDTQPTGGKFDGILGVLGALEAIRALNDAGIQTRRPLTVINWTNEEGSRFPPSMLASGVYSGKVSMDDIELVKDAEGVSFRDELNRSGYAGTEPVGTRRFHAYLELHIEQGPVLESEGIEIGVVTGSQGMCWNRVRVEGQEAHAGPTPMDSRLDAMAAAARLISFSFEMASAISDARATVGIIEARPASHNTIPHTVEFVLDLRHPNDRVLDDMLGRLDDALAREHRYGFEVSRLPFGSPAPSTRFDPVCIDAIERSAENAGFSHRRITSGAGHDAVYLSDVVPTGMIFTPCIGGISHNPAESITPEQAKAGADVLLGAVLELAD